MIFENKVDFHIKVNNLGQKETIKNYNEELVKILHPHFAALSEDSQIKLSNGNALRILESKHESDIALLSETSLPSMKDHISKLHQDAFDESLSLFRSLHPGREIIQDDKLVRGLDYYNGLCFEIQISDPEMTGVLGQQQNTLLAGGRYDYLANQFGYRGKHLPAVGWAAGVDRIMMVLQSLEEKKRFKVETEPRINETIGILSQITPSEEAEYGSQVRQRCFQIKQQLQNMAGPDTQVQLDLRSKVKFQDKLTFMMNNQNSFLKHRS